jgi:hypothetical protein
MQIVLKLQASWTRGKKSREKNTLKETINTFIRELRENN